MLLAHMLAWKHWQCDTTHGYGFIIFPSAVNNMLLGKQKATHWEMCAVYICPHTWLSNIKRRTILQPPYLRFLWPQCHFTCPACIICQTSFVRDMSVLKCSKSVLVWRNHGFKTRAKHLSKGFSFSLLLWWALTKLSSGTATVNEDCKKDFVSLWVDQHLSPSLGWENPLCIPIPLGGCVRKSLPFSPHQKNSLCERLASFQSHQAKAFV